MPVRRLAFALVGMLSTTASVVADPDIITITRQAQTPVRPEMGSSLDMVPPLLSVPESPAINTPSVPCTTTPNAYFHGHAYLPQTNPDGRAGLCGNDPRHQYRLWVNAAYFLGITEDLGKVERKETHGVRLGLGYWFHDARAIGADLSFFTTHDTYDEFTSVPAYVNAPVVFTGGDANLRLNLVNFDRFRFDGLVGYRLLHLSETFNSFSDVEPTILAHGDNLVHAFQLGAIGHYHFGPYFGELATKVGFGNNRQRHTLNGIATTDNKLAIVPEINFRLGYSLGSGTRSYFGYNFIYLSDAVRPNNLGPNDFSLNAFTFGLEFLY